MRFLTTVAESRSLQGASERQSKRSGQSVVEFALLVPVIVGFFYILLQVETAISTSIVYQKYARMRLHFMAFNHRYYPQVKFLVDGRTNKLYQRWWIGVDDNINFEIAQPRPRAPVVGIGRVGVPEDQSEKTEYPAISRRQKVRVRVASFTCLPPVAAKPGQLFTEGFLGEDTFSGGNFHYCSN